MLALSSGSVRWRWRERVRDRGHRWETETHTQTNGCTQDNNESSAFGTLWGIAYATPSLQTHTHTITTSVHLVISPASSPLAVWLLAPSGYKMRQALVTDPHTFCLTVMARKRLSVPQCFTYSHKYTVPSQLSPSSTSARVAQWTITNYFFFLTTHISHEYVHCAWSRSFFLLLPAFTHTTSVSPQEGSSYVADLSFVYTQHHPPLHGLAPTPALAVFAMSWTKSCTGWQSSWFAGNSPFHCWTMTLNRISVLPWVVPRWSLICIWPREIWSYFW